MTGTAPSPSGAADPRPRAAERDGTVTIAGRRCTACRYPTAQDTGVCPLCRGPLEDAAFGPDGEVFASTVLQVRVPGHRPPTGVAYLVLDDGPRILVHTPGDRPLPPGARARLTSVTGAGDLVARLQEDPWT